MRVTQGHIERKHLFRVIRNGKVLQDGLYLHSMKKLHEDATNISKGQECGISFENFHKGPIQERDIIECYKEADSQEEKKFNGKPGVHHEY